MRTIRTTLAPTATTTACSTRRSHSRITPAKVGTLPDTSPDTPPMRLSNVGAEEPVAPARVLPCHEETPGRCGTVKSGRESEWNHGVEYP